MHCKVFKSGFLFWLSVSTAVAAPLKDATLQKYFEREVARIERGSFKGIDSREDWERERPRLVRELREMLALEPMPERGDLKAVVTGMVEREGIVVERVHFQSSPGLYVTGNLYRPARVEASLPAVLYLCGHAQVKTNGVSYGNKVGYQHHGAWFARNGYVCLTIDTIQLGEIEGVHHGTHREGMWWWNSRGYTPAGVEAWNSIRALDYLQMRPEVDMERMGVTGRSGGGASSWWVAALDERVKVAAPVAGITDLRDHAVDGVVEGHCDCMYFVNTYQWDYPMVAALVAPRALLIANSDKDTIFPLDGVMRTHAVAARVYQWMGAEKNLGLLITEGPHKDTQDLQLPVFRWFNRHLKGEDPLIQMAATKMFSGQELKVFEKIPKDEITSRVHETFVPNVSLAPDSKAKNRQKLNGVLEVRIKELRKDLREKVFAGWPKDKVAMNLELRETSGGWREVQFDSSEGVRLKMFLPRAAGAAGKSLVILTEEPKVLEGESAILVVRGGTDAKANNRAAIQIRRRYMLVGQTLDGMRVWDIIRSIELLEKDGWEVGKLKITGDQGENATLAKVMMGLNQVWVDFPKDTQDLKRSDYLNLLRYTSWSELSELARPFN